MIAPHFFARAGIGGRFGVLACLLAALVLWTSPRPALAQDAPRPNLVFIMADDLGWRDLGVYGSDFYETPHLDRLAARGLRFTNAYAASPLCSPTRASVLTGQYPGRIGMTAPHGHLPKVVLKASPSPAAEPKYRATSNISVSRLANEYRTYAEDLRDAGYATAFLGKWHLGFDPYIPENQGFDFVVGGGGYPGPRSFLSPYNMPEIPDGPAGEHISDRMVDEALGFIDANAGSGKPFLLNYWTWDVHAPFQAKPETIEKYRKKLEANPDVVQKSALMGAMVEAMDESVGRLLDGLDERGLTDDTIVVFFSDNGGNMYDRPEGVTPTDNAPLRNGKGNIHEGGVRVPMIVAWPGHVEEGAVTDALACSIDLYPTFLDWLDLAPQPGQVIDGVSLSPVILGDRTPTLNRDAIVIDFPHNVVATENLASIAVRRGPWKLIRFYWDAHVEPGQPPAHRHALYNLEEDIGESNNRAGDYPDVVVELAGLLNAYVRNTGAVVPNANPNAGREPVTVAGWSAQKDAELSLVEGSLKIVATGNDAILELRDDVPAVDGPLELRVRIRSDADGYFQLFWAAGRQRGFAGARSVKFDVTNDGEPHDYSVSFDPGEPLRALRIDPSRGPGTIFIESMSLHDAEGKMLAEWTFSE